MIQTWDELTAKWAAHHVTDRHVPVLRAVTHLGGTEVAVSAGILAALAGRARRGSWRPAIELAVIIGGQNLIHNAIKGATRRTRPVGPHHSHFAGTSFPSGHTTTAAAAWPAIVSAIAPAAPVGLRVAGYAPGPAVASTRVLLGVHWLSDVLAGLALGWGWLALTKLFVRRGRPS